MSNTATEGKPANMAEVFKFFAQNGYTMEKFRNDWRALTDQDKTDLRNGIGNGTLTY